jgi:hypothetical protein
MKGKFFIVPIRAIEEIVSRTNSVEALLGYLILRRSAQRDKDVCTGGAPSIATRLGLTRYKAEEVIAALHTVKWGDGPEERVLTTPEAWNEGKGSKVPGTIRGYPVKVLPVHTENQIALPNALVDGIDGNIAPVRQILRLDPKEDRLDAVRLLLKLYQHHSWADYGGVDPKVVRRDWIDHGDLSPRYQEHFSRQVQLGYVGRQEDRHADLHYWLVEPGNYEASLTVIQEIGRTNERFWKLFDDLQELDFFYEVAVVFDANPLANLFAETCYPLYIFDRIAREEAGRSLALAVQDFAGNSGFLGAHQLQDLPGAIYSSEKEVGSGLFLFAAKSHAAKLVNILRLRFRPHTEDTSAGYQGERQKVEDWNRTFKSVGTGHAEIPMVL